MKRLFIPQGIKIGKNKEKPEENSEKIVAGAVKPEANLPEIKLKQPYKPEYSNEEKVITFSSSVAD
jgi:hypothetical protein